MTPGSDGRAGSYPVAFGRLKREDAEEFGKEIEGRAKGYGEDELTILCVSPKSDWVRV